MDVGKRLAYASSNFRGGGLLRDVSHGDLLRRYAAAEITENPDGTFDMLGVELLAAGGPVHGVGSPPEGDYWTLEQLQGMAQAAEELGPEIVPPNKIGHADEQVLVQNSIDAGEIPTPADGEMPAAGWITNQRVEGAKLVGDIKRVPKIVKDVITMGAYRKRSAELSKVTSQVSGKKYPWVVSGLAWLGGKQPAVKTLGDVVALYEARANVERVFVTDETIAGPGLEDFRGVVRDELNRRLTLRDGRSDTGAMFTKEQMRKFAAAAGLEVDAVTEKMLEDAGVAPEPTAPDAEKQAAEEKAAAEKAAADKKAADEAGAQEDRELQQRVKLLEEQNRSLSEENRLERRRTFVDATIRAAKIAPGQRTSLESLFDKGETEARAFVDELKPREDLLSELGTEHDDDDERSLEEQNRDYADDASGRLSIDAKEIV